MPFVGCITAFKVTKRGGKKSKELILREPFTLENKLHVEEPMKKKSKKGKKSTAKKDEKTTPPAPVSAVLVAPIYFPISMTLAGVFGEYSSLEVGIHLPIYGNLTDFEKKIDEAMPRIVGKIQSIMNQITVGSGFGPCWNIAEPNPSAQIPASTGQQGMGPAAQQLGHQTGQTGSSVAGFPPSPNQE